MTAHDPLTGLHDRHDLEAQLRQMASAARRHGLPLSILMLDIDHFKAVNDTFGHAGGDAVLRAFAVRLPANLRAEDVVGRWGGEVFLVLLPFTGLAGAAVVAERIRATVADQSLGVLSGVAPVTVSVGCATGTGEDPEALLRDAGAALYEAKQSGRNRVIAAQARC
jgi:two-component system cell cycle response regulator